jgi:hypothetical protein
MTKKLIKTDNNESGVVEHNASASNVQTTGENVPQSEGSDLDNKIEEVFRNFPKVKRVWHDGEGVFFSECKPGMKKVNR